MRDLLWFEIQFIHFKYLLININIYHDFAGVYSKKLKIEQFCIHLVSNTLYLPFIFVNKRRPKYSFVFTKSVLSSTQRITEKCSTITDCNSQSTKLFTMHFIIVLKSQFAKDEIRNATTFDLLEVTFSRTVFIILFMVFSSLFCLFSMSGTATSTRQSSRVL